jgi:ABC-2 type transport system permease protein
MNGRRVLAVARRHAYVLWRSPHRLFDVTVWPVVDLLLFGSIGVAFARGDAPGGPVVAQLVAGVVLWHVLYQAQISLSTGMLEETWSRNLLNLLVTPLREVEYAAGVALFGLVKLVLGVGLVVVMGAVAFAFDVTLLGWEALFVAAVLLAVGWAVSLFVIGLVLRFGSGAEALAWGILFALMPMSGIFYPVEALPGALQPVARALPTSHAFAALRAVVAGDPFPWGRLGLAVVGTVVLMLAGVAFVARMLALFRDRGYVTRYS